MRLNDSGVFLTRVLQAEFLFAFDLHHLRVMHSDFHSTKAQVSQRDGFTLVVVRIQRALAAIDATVAIDGEGKVAGLHFAPAANADAQ